MAAHVYQGDLARPPLAGRAPDVALLGVTVVLFVASATLTAQRATSMAAMPGLPMPGDWTLSMAWTPMPGQSWLGTAATFLTMWIVMMVAMMLPVLVPMLARYREVVAPTEPARLGWLTTVVGTAYFAVWAGVGVVLFPCGTAISSVLAKRPVLAGAVPVVVGLTVIVAGAFQLSARKAHDLACCRRALAPAGADMRTAWRHGIALSVHCLRCSANLMAIALVLGLMDLRPMTVVAAAMAAERLAPARWAVSRSVGIASLIGGTWLTGRALGLV